MSLHNTISQNDSNQTQHQLEQEQPLHRPYNVHSSSSTPPISAKNNTTSSLLESQFLSNPSKQSLFSMDGTHGHFNINADVGASEFLFDQSFEESYIQYVPQQQMPYDMPYITTEFQPLSILHHSMDTPLGSISVLTPIITTASHLLPSPLFSPNDTQLRRKRKADDDDPLPSSVRIKRAFGYHVYRPGQQPGRNADHCTYFPEDNLDFGVDDSFQFQESFVPDKSHPAQHVGQMLMVGLVDDKVNDDIRTLITKYRVGAIILSSRNMKGLCFFFWFFWAFFFFFLLMFAI